MRCPKCNQAMQSITHEGTTADRCTGCGGLWFDALEAEDLLDSKNGARIDTGSVSQGRKTDRIRNIQCPKCGKPMQTVSDTKDPEVQFEVCATCHGYFMDAGEFRELAEDEKDPASHQKIKIFSRIFNRRHHVG